MKRTSFFLGFVALALSANIIAQQQAPAAPQHRPVRSTYASKGEIEVLPVQGSVYLLAGAGSNVTVQVGPDAVMVVDTNEAAMSEKILAAIRGITKAPIRYIVNTSPDADHIGGNEGLAKSTAGNVNAFFGQGARVYSSENAYLRLSNPKDGSAPIPFALWPTDSFAGPKKTMFVTGEGVELIHQPNAHTDGDLIVYFRKSDVIATGDVFVLNSFPVIDPARGGSLQGIIDAQNQLIDIAIPEFNTMGGTRVIPGHGRIANEIDLVESRDALTIIRDRLVILASQNATIDQVKAAGVVLEYDGMYGTKTGAWTTDKFLETAYADVRSNLPKLRQLTTRNIPGGLNAATPARTTEAAPSRTPGRRASASPLEGTWALNLFKSKYTPSNTAPYRREMTLSFAGEELTHSTSTWRRTGGNDSPLGRTTYTARIDGKEYTIPASASKVTFKRVNATSVVRTATGDRGATETATWTLSPDGKLLTIETTGKDGTGAAFSSTQVYERLP